MTLLRLAALLLTLGFSTAAVADVCLSDATAGVFFQFQKLKIPKKGGTVVPAVGLEFTQTSVNALPLSGTLLRDGNTGKLYLGFTSYFQECIVNAVLDDTLNGTVAYDCNLDGANDGTHDLSVADCPS